VLSARGKLSRIDLFVLERNGLLGRKEGSIWGGVRNSQSRISSGKNSKHHMKLVTVKTKLSRINSFGQGRSRAMFKTICRKIRMIQRGRSNIFVQVMCCYKLPFGIETLLVIVNLLTL